MRKTRRCALLCTVLVALLVLSVGGCSTASKKQWNEILMHGPANATPLERANQTADMTGRMWSTGLGR